MKITRITVFHVDLPLEHPYWLSGGRLKFEVLDATIVKVETDAGITGWGEGTPWGHTYVPAHGPGIRAGIETMAPFILGLDPRKFLEVERAMDLALPDPVWLMPGLVLMNPLSTETPTTIVNLSTVTVKMMPSSVQMASPG